MNFWDFLDARAARKMAARASTLGERRREFDVLRMIAAGLIIILLAIIVGLFATSRPGFALPNWAENVLISIATATALKLGDCLAALVTLATGRQIEQFGNRLAESSPNAEQATGKPGDPIHQLEEKA